MSVRVAVPSKGRLREGVLDLLQQAGMPTSVFHGSGARVMVDGIEFIEMRPADAAAWLAAGRISGGFLATDLVLEEGLDLDTVPLGLSRSDLVVASREDDGRKGLHDLEGATVATHRPRIATRLFAEQGVDATVVSMGGALEGVCAAGLADAIMDLRETGTSLAQNRLRVLHEVAACQALFVHDGAGVLHDLTLRFNAVLAARARRYVMLHLPSDQVDQLTNVFSGLAAPTVLPLSGHDDLVAVHLVVPAADFWSQLPKLQALGATGIVALPPDALLP